MIPSSAAEIRLDGAQAIRSPSIPACPRVFPLGSRALRRKLLSVFCIESSIVWAGDTAIMVPFWEAYAVATLGLGEFVGPLDAESSSPRTWITLGYSGLRAITVRRLTG